MEDSLTRTLLLDCDSLVYAACKAHEYETNWGNDLWTVHGHLEPAIEHLNDAVAGLRETLDADNVVMALSDYQNPWRRIIMPTYKSNRKDVRKPVCFRPLREYVHEMYRTFQRPGLEGDDVLGVLLTNPAMFPGDEKVCVSLDKDMKTLPGKHYNMQKEVEFERSEDDADYFFYTQILTGDTTDGYGGCKGVGKVSAEKILAPFHKDVECDCWKDDNGTRTCHCGETEFDRVGAWQAIVKAYTKAGLSEDEAIRTARVARILRHGEYHYDKKEVILWEPPSSTPR